ncbi:sugar phosphate isomerase/epimerase [Methanohalophilus levihalophilus]|uniref:sugar phosphate isomerase/epimerase family protein n=1 Tax=Methanohalophilus levihalophilus TaxID=1431282 RepID=UPI001AE4C606|nr:sugar phosphate isomerase/epimerase family protein [Methanohalophilus levihalophilus]MBP2030928.1 sugar phosphate isomerase/epimerase [Methanohalophilus levihalophilus]
MIGVSSFAYHDLPLSEALSRIENIAPCAEIFSEGQHDLLNENEVAFSYDLEYTVHAPTSDLNLASIREPIRKASIEILTEMAEICVKLDSKIMVVHPGYVAFPHDRELALKAFSKSVSLLEQIYSETGVKICVENMPMWECFLFREPGLDIGNNFFTLDVGHANTMGNLSDFLEMEISHFHLHDNNGEGDDHHPIGAGEIDYASLQSLLLKNSSIKIVENRCEADVMESIRVLQQMGIN